MLKNKKEEVLHFSINTTQVPTCTNTDLTSLYFGRNTVSVAKKSTVPLTQSFAVQLICLNKDYLYTPPNPSNLVRTILRTHGWMPCTSSRSRPSKRSAVAVGS